MPKFKIHEIGGVIPAQITPFFADGGVNEAGVRKSTQFLIDSGVTGLYLTGSTGEGFLMSPEERKRVVAAVTETVAGRIPVIVHVGAISTFHSISLAENAQECGADAISSVPPIYWPFTPDQIFNYYSDITAATDLPMIVYNISLAGALGFEMLQRLSTIKGVAGVKYTAPTHFEIMRMKSEIAADFRVYSGSDEMAMSGLSFGADALIGSFYNVMPQLYLRLLKAMQNGQLAEAQALQEKANAVIFFTLKQHPIAAIKRIMTWQGADAGYCRGPFDNYFDAEADKALRNKYIQFAKEVDLSGVDFIDAL